MHNHPDPESRQVGNSSGNTVVITGAFSYTGKYATRLLLRRRYRIRTLTYHPERENPFGEKVQVFPYSFEHPERLRETLRGASALINTYWVRFPHGKVTFDGAVKNTRTLIAAAKDAGVRHIVHVSIANPSLHSPLGYYNGKAQLERAVAESGLAYTILRPTVIFGLEEGLSGSVPEVTSTPSDQPSPSVSGLNGFVPSRISSAFSSPSSSTTSIFSLGRKSTTYSAPR